MPNCPHLHSFFAPIHLNNNRRLNGVWLESSVIQKGKASSTSVVPCGCTTIKDPRTSGAASQQHPAAVASWLTSGPERKRWLSLGPLLLQFVHCLLDAFPHIQSAFKTVRWASLELCSWLKWVDIHGEILPERRGQKCEGFHIKII